MTPLDMVVSKLQAAGCVPSPKGTNAYESRCPVHHGKRKNLSVAVGEDGRVLLNCHHAGENGSPSCPVDAIVGAIGLRLEDLYPKSNGPSTTKPKTSGKKSWRTLEAALAAVASQIEPKPVKTESWTYHDANGNVAMVMGRFDPAKGKKTYRPFYQPPGGSWVCSDPPGLLLLYRLPEVIKHTRTVFVVEGEKCVLALDKIRVVATTSAHGSESPHKTDWTPLAGKPVVILPDHDAPGEGYAAAVLRILKGLNPRPPWVKVVRLPGLADGEDVADWIPRVVGDRVGDEAREAVCGELQALVEAAPGSTWTRSWTPPAKPHDLWGAFPWSKPRSRFQNGPTRPRTRRSTGWRARWSG